MTTKEKEHTMATEDQRVIPATLAIGSYMHCGLCLASLPSGKSAREWAQLDVGFTKLGIQVWCKRHECNVMHVDFQGARHPANLQREPLTLQAFVTALTGEDNHTATPWGALVYEEMGLVEAVVKCSDGWLFYADVSDDFHPDGASLPPDYHAATLDELLSAIREGEAE